jgi:hypothetical protein
MMGIGAERMVNIRHFWSPTMSPFPRSLLEFQRQFLDEAACAAYLADQRWPEGFVCPVCGGKRGWALET